MKVLLASSSTVALPTLDALKGAGLLTGILSSPDRPVGRGREIAPNEFARVCQDDGYKVFKPESATELNQIIQTQKPDLVVTIAYGKLIKKEELELPPLGWLNIHFSILPRWRGAAPVQRALLAGDTRTGITVFKLDQGMDTGPIYSTYECDVPSDATTETLLNALAGVAPIPLMKAIEMISQRVEPIAQSSTGVMLAAKITKDDGRIDWNNTSSAIDRQVRALIPWPGAWSTIRDIRILIHETRVIEHSPHSSGPNGSVLSCDPLTISCNDGALEIMRVKPEGKREMTSAEWLRGFTLQPGEIFS